jgi:hypothetical protein
MEVEATTPPFEVRCAACQCSFAAGTKQCVHCGGPLGTGVDAAWLRAAAGRADDGEPSALGPGFAKVFVYVAMGVVAVALQMLKACSER